MDLFQFLTEREVDSRIPKVIAYNRIDGPGSSLDLREFQQAFWRIPDKNCERDDPSVSWSRSLPRTVGITIDIGCVAEAYPLPAGKIGVNSSDYGTGVIAKPGNIPFQRENWLVKLVELFNLQGILIKLHNIRPGLKSSGLGGSATATTAVCLLANELAGRPFSGEQLIAMASIVEQDMGVSITGTQEQSNVVFGGITDYVWFPWGKPGKPGAYGTSKRFELLTREDYPELESRLRLFHTLQPRDSIDVNTEWRKKLADPDGYLLHQRKLEIAYNFREALRMKNWKQMGDAIKAYRFARIKLCKEYMTEACWDIQGQCEAVGAESFPLGAGGGGTVLVFCHDPEALKKLDIAFQGVFRRIDFSIREKGHKFENLTQ